MMISKFLRVAFRFSPMTTTVLYPKKNVRVIPVRVMSHLIPPSQYDMPWPKRLKFMYVIKTYWETIPLFTVTATAMCILFYSILWACRNKVDVVFTTHSRENISNTMDLRNPSVHKIIIINQRYAPWPEMQDVLDKMKAAEKRALAHAQTCAGK